MYHLREFLEDQFALQQTLHGSLVDVYGIGLLLLGKSGIGKSEVALDLIERGHRLVADDVVVVSKKSESVLIGSGTELTQHFMEIRGLGIVDVRAMFGIRAIRFQKRVEVVVGMELWEPEKEYTRLGMVEDHYEVLDTRLPLVKLPIVPGKNVTVICEVIAMNHLLRHYGYDPAQVLARRLAERIRSKDDGSLAPAPEHGVVRARHRVSAPPRPGWRPAGEGGVGGRGRSRKESGRFLPYPRAVRRTGLTTSGHPDIFRTRIFPEPRLMPTPPRGCALWTKPGCAGLAFAVFTER
jgi:hypothetical protein